MKEFKINTSSITERDTESITRYLREVNHFDRITPDEEARLAHIIRQGGKAADVTGLDAVTVHNIVSVSGKVSSIDTPLSDDSDTVFADTLMSASVTDSLLDRESLDNEIEDILNTYLSDREMIVVRKYYGIGCAEATLDDIAATIGKSRERTRQIYLNAIAKLRRSPKTMSLAMYLAA